MTRLNMPDDVPIESKMVTRAIKSAQTQVEQQNFEIRKNVLKYDEVLNRQRKVIYAERRRVLEGEDLHEQIRQHDRRRGHRLRRRRHRRGLRRGLGPRPAVDGAAARCTRSSITVDDGSSEAGGTGGLTRDVLLDASCVADAQAAYDQREEQLGAGDRCASWSAGWCSPCSTASGASTSTRWTTSRRASACARWPSATRWSSTSARASTCFDAMIEAIKEESVGFLFNLEVQVRARWSGEQVEDGAAAAGHRGQGPGPAAASRTHLQYSAPTVDGEGGVEVHDEDASGRSGPTVSPGAEPGVNRAERRAGKKRRR